jgi:hypothetical protein
VALPVRFDEIVQSWDLVFSTGGLESPRIRISSPSPPMLSGTEWKGRMDAWAICVPHPAGIRIHIAPESVFTISWNAYSHGPNSAV